MKMPPSVERICHLSCLKQEKIKNKWRFQMSKRRTASGNYKLQDTRPKMVAKLDQVLTN